MSKYLVHIVTEPEFKIILGEKRIDAEDRVNSIAAVLMTSVIGSVVLCGSVTNFKGAFVITFLVIFASILPIFSAITMFIIINEAVITDLEYPENAKTQIDAIIIKDTINKEGELRKLSKKASQEIDKIIKSSENMERKIQVEENREKDIFRNRCMLTVISKN